MRLTKAGCRESIRLEVSRCVIYRFGAWHWERVERFRGHLLTHPLQKVLS
jgi:hypothetical protein